MRIKLFWGIILLFTSASVSAQFPKEMKSMNISTGNGLPSSFVMKLTVDGQGFVWAATEGGVARITGNDIITYTTDNSDIADNKIHTVYYDATSNCVFCVTHNKGISVFDCITQTFKTYNSNNGLIGNQIKGIEPAQDGGLWIVADMGLQYYNQTTHKHIEYSAEKYQGLPFNLRCCAEDRFGYLFIGGDNSGLAILNLSNGAIEIFHHDPTDPSSLPGNTVRKIFIDHTNNIWVGTNQGLGLYLRQSDRFICFRHDDNNSYSLAGNNIMNITEDSQHKLMVSSDLGGLSVLDLDSVATTGEYLFENWTDSNFGLSSINTRDVIKDQFGNYWVANYSTGIDFFSDQLTMFKILHDTKYYGDNPGINRRYALASDDNGDIWLGGENELTLFHNNKEVESWNMSPYLQQTKTIPYIMTFDSHGILWIGLNDEGILTFNPQTEIFTRISPEDEFFDVHAFKEDDGVMMIGYERGIFTYKNGLLKAEEQYLPENQHLCVYALEKDSLGRLWVGTLGQGLFIFDDNGHQYVHYSRDNGFCSDNINQIYKDSDGAFWIATYAGLVYFPTPSNETTRTTYSKDSGLRNIHIRAVLEDINGGIWISTNDGISHFNARTKQFDNYNNLDGRHIGSFVESSAARGKDNTIYFGSPEGVCYCELSKLTNSHPSSLVHFTRIEIPKSYSSSWTALPMDVETNEKIVLNRHSNNIRISFASEDNSMSSTIEYSYLMSRVMSDWYNNGSDNHATFWGLRPGQYTFSLRAKNQNEQWNDHAQKQLEIVVRPSIWWSATAKVFYCLIFLALLYFFYRFVMLKVSLNSEKEKNRNEQILNDERLRFFTNVTHELRTPLTLILGPLEDLVNDPNLPPPYSARISNIHKSSLRLHNLINQILEFRKTQTQNKKLVIQRGDLAAHVKDVGERFRELNSNNRTEVILDVEETGANVYFDREIITTIISNLMSNALKYTPSGSVVLSLRKQFISDVPYFSMSVKDTGYGIGQDELPFVFNRYYQVKGSYQASGTGIGLALVKSLSDVHMGLIDVSSEVNLGSTFTFSIMAEYNYPEAMHRDSPKEPVIEKINGTAPSSMYSFLVVEDDADILRYIQESLSMEFNIMTAKDGQEGLDLAMSTIPDLIISDIMMPKMNGIQLCQTLKHDVRTSHIPIILLTAKDSIQDKTEGYDSGADSYITKPFSITLLRSRINNILELRRKLTTSLVGTLSAENGTQMNNDPREDLTEYDRDFLQRFDDLILENLDNDNLDISLLLSSFNMSYSTFYRKIKGLTNITAKEYIKKKRLQKAMEFLKTGRYNVSEVCYMVGYGHLGNFREAFKAEYNMTPSQVLHKK